MESFLKTMSSSRFPLVGSLVGKKKNFQFLNHPRVPYIFQPRHPPVSPTTPWPFDLVSY